MGCRSCDTTIISAKPQIRFQYTGDTLFCPNDVPVRLRDNIKLSSGELNDTIYGISLSSFNGNSNPPSNIQRILEKNGSIFMPRVAVGKAIFAIESPKYCYADGSIGLRIQDTIAITYTVSPDTVVRLPRTSFTFSANTNSPSVWWYFGTGNKADTSLLDPITWSFDSKIADYKVSVRSFHNNGCYGEYTRTVSVWDVSGLEKFDRESKITQDLRMISNDWQFDQLNIFDAQGKLVHQTNVNGGAPKFGLSPGIYTYKLRAHDGQIRIEKSGKWLNFGE